MRHLILMAALFLTACGGDEAVQQREVSRAVSVEPAAGGITYQQFKSHKMNDGGDSFDAQKRFLVLDRNNNGRLDPNEIGGQ